MWVYTSSGKLENEVTANVVPTLESGEASSCTWRFPNLAKPNKHKGRALNTADRFEFWASQILRKCVRILNKYPYMVIYSMCRNIFTGFATPKIRNGLRWETLSSKVISSNPNDSTNAQCRVDAPIDAMRAQHWERCDGDEASILCRRVCKRMRVSWIDEGRGVEANINTSCQSHLSGGLALI
jgi:hypothetical protein